MTELRTPDMADGRPLLRNLDEAVRDAAAAIGTQAAVEDAAAAKDYWIATGQELTRFCSYRLSRNFKAVDRLASCRTGEDLLAATSAIASGMLHDYAEEFDRLFARGQKRH